MITVFNVKAELSIDPNIFVAEGINKKIHTQKQKHTNTNKIYYLQVVTEV